MLGCSKYKFYLVIQEKQISALKFVVFFDTVTVPNSNDSNFDCPIVSVAIKCSQAIKLLHICDEE